MYHHPQTILRAGALLALFCILQPLLPEPRRQDPTAPFPRRGEYIGSERCIECHARRRTELVAGHHGGIMDAGLDGCETCHGPGKAHADHPDNDPLLITWPPALAAERQVTFCGRCHGPEISDHGGDLPGLLAAGRKCTDCHAVHTARKAPPHEGVHFTAALDSKAVAATGAARCVECHPLRDESLARSPHSSLQASSDPGGCEGCHGNGALHAASNGIARLITRPDRASDGVATCRRCHADVDPLRFHWRERQAPLLGGDLTCTTCHRVHEPRVVGAAATNRLCAECHAPAMCVLPGTRHAELGRLDTPLAKGCGACHAGAEAHARSGGRADLIERPRESSAARQLAACGECHGGERSLAHAAQGAHFRNGVGCLACHSPAVAAGDVTADAERNCRQCHPDVAAQFRQPNHHPVPEGRMWCSSCHDAHTARPRLRDRELTETRCVQCHREYRGPFFFAHQAGRQDGCVTCHLPHGSGNRRLLRQASAQQNCIACHADFPSFHDQTRGAIYTNCLGCHTEVHGSNHSRLLFR